MQHAQGFLELSQTARQHIQETTVTVVKQRLDAQENFYLIDVREDREWLQGHIPQAIHLGKGVIERDIEAAIPNREADIVLYCGGGYRSALAAESLQKMGYQQVSSMDGGVRAWVEQQLPLAQPDSL